MYPTKKHVRQAREAVKPSCANCGKKHPRIVFFDGKWYCPGACDVTRKKT